MNSHDAFSEGWWQMDVVFLLWLHSGLVCLPVHTQSSKTIRRVRVRVAQCSPCLDDEALDSIPSTTKTKLNTSYSAPLPSQLFVQNALSSRCTSGKWNPARNSVREGQIQYVILMYDTNIKLWLSSTNQAADLKIWNKPCARCEDTHL